MVGTLVSRVDPRKLMAFGFVSISSALYYMSSVFSLTMDFRTAFLMRTFQMFGLAFIFVPAERSGLCGRARFPREKNNQISSMNSFVRNVGGSIGIALMIDRLRF
jgi:DHA2 family multidrug resistance protein